MQEKQYIVEGAFMVTVQARGRLEAERKAMEKLEGTDMVATVVNTIKNE